METIESPLQPQKPSSTGGLKLMTVFIGVLALHVVVIAAFTICHLLSHSSSELIADKNKMLKVAPDGLHGDEPEASETGSSAPTTPAPTTAATVASTPGAPQSDSVQTPSQTATSPLTGPVQMPTIPMVPATTPVADATRELPIVPAAPTTRTYTVRSGDSLVHIARMHRVTLHHLKALNHLISDELFVGQRLVLPGAGSTSPLETASAPEETSAVLTEPLATTSVASTDADQALLAPTPSHARLYTVVRGDTLTRLARRFHTTSAKLMALNGITDPRKLSVGQKLRLPSHLQNSNSASNQPTEVAPSSPVDAASVPSGRLANLNR